MNRAALALAIVAGCAHAARPVAQAPSAPTPDREAIEEATRDSYEPERYVSARAYRHYLAALLSRGDDDAETAAAELREALVYDPDSPHLHSVLADVLVHQGRVAEAEEHVRRALALDPEHAPAHLLAARIAEARDRPAEARAHLRAAIRAAPGEGDAYRALVLLEIEQAELLAASAAAAELTAALHQAQKEAAGDADADGGAVWSAERLADSAAAAWVDLARALAQRKDDAGAAEAFAQARAASPSDAESMSAESSFLEGRRRYPEARELQLRLLAMRPESAEVIATLARLSLEEGDAESASLHARKLLALAADITETTPQDERQAVASALLRVAVPLLGARRSAEAQTALDGALRLFPRHAELTFYKALALVQRGQPREGMLLFEQVDRQLASAAIAPAFLGVEPATLRLDARVQAAVSRGRAGERAESCRRLKAIFAAVPREDGVALALLEGCDRAGRMGDAVQLLSAARRAHPDSDVLLYALGTALDRQGKKAEALAAMRRVLVLSPQHTGALNFIGYSLVEDGGSLDEAKGLLSRALELRPDDGAIADSWGFCLLRRGEVQRALEELTRASRLSPGDPVVLSHLGDALLANGRRADAGAAFAEALARLSARPPKSAAKMSAGAPGAPAVDPPDRAPEPSDGKVRAELLVKLRSLTAR